MFSQIRIVGLGPHDDTTLDVDPLTSTFVEGASESGKSTLAEAIAFCLWGLGLDGKPLPVDAIREGHKAVEVTLTTRKGATLRRRMTHSRRIERWVDDECFTSDRKFAKRLSTLHDTWATGKKGEVLKGFLALAPFSWVPLAESEGCGRHLRDVLVSVLEALVPGSDRDEVARLMEAAGFELRADDITDDEKVVAANRADAKKHRDRAEGALREAEASIPELVEVEPVPDTTAARAVLDAAEAWTAYRAAEARHADAYAAQTSWDERHAWLVSQRPTVDEAALAKARSKVATLRAEVRHEEDVQRRATQDADAARRAYELAELATDPAVEKATARVQHLRGEGPCPTCGQDRPGADPAALAEAEAALATAQAEAELRRKATLKELRDKLLQHEARVSEAGHKAQIARTALASAEKYLDELKAQAARVEGYDQSLRALGDRPILPPMPVSPEGVEPTREAVAEARALLERAARAAGAAEQARRARDAAIARADEARRKFLEAEAEVARQEALVDAVRRAPGERLRRGMEALDLGPVSITVEGSGVRVLIDGRDWKRASRGRKVYADMCFRAALRRAAKMVWFPLVVDDCNAWSGEWPDLGGPVLYLTTTTGPMRVVAQREAA